MENPKKRMEQLIITYLSIQPSTFNRVHHFDTKARKIHNSFGYIIKGSAEFSTITEKVTASEGDVIFIPQGTRYISHWMGDPQISFINIHFLTQNNIPSSWQSLRLQRIDGGPAEEIRRLIMQLYEHPIESDPDLLMAFSHFYELAAILLPFMKVNMEETLPELLQQAINYIEKNYSSISHIKDISQACYISESRLYHLFKEYLNTSPVTYLNKLRIQTAMERLKTTDDPIQLIAEQLNYHSEYNFRKTFQKITGVLPSQFRKLFH